MPSTLNMRWASRNRMSLSVAAADDHLGVVIQRVAAPQVALLIVGHSRHRPSAMASGPGRGSAQAAAGGLDGGRRQHQRCSSARAAPMCHRGPRWLLGDEQHRRAITKQRAGTDEERSGGRIVIGLDQHAGHPKQQPQASLPLHRRSHLPAGVAVHDAWRRPSATMVMRGPSRSSSQRATSASGVQDRFAVGHRLEAVVGRHTGVLGSWLARSHRHHGTREIPEKCRSNA